VVPPSIEETPLSKPEPATEITQKDPEPILEPVPEFAPIETPPIDPINEIESPSPSLPEKTDFDPLNVTEELKSATFFDVRDLIRRLNDIIQRKDYDAWRSHLTADYIAQYSDSATLSKLSDSTVLKRLGIKLDNIKDYFLYVVYPSRQNDRVDDIDFIGERIIKAITVNQKGERLVLYNLEKIGDSWMIGIGR